MTTALRGEGFDSAGGGFKAITIGDRRITKDELLALIEPKAPVRVKATDTNLGNVAFLYSNGAGEWSCMLANGTPAAFSYAGIRHDDEAECRLMLRGVTDATQAIAVIEKYARRYLSGPRASGLVCTYEVLGDVKPMRGVYLHVFHGRDTVEEDMEDWGYDGPVIGPLNYVHTTYQSDLKFACSPEVASKFFSDEQVYSWSGDVIEGRIVLNEGLLQIGGKFYGDWSVFGPELVKVADDGVLVAL